MATPKSDDRGRGSGIAPAGLREVASLYVSIVCAIDGARFVAVGSSEQECLARVASYVAEQAVGQLTPPSACRVSELLAAGDAGAAVSEYFRHAGERWETEWLVTTSLHPDSRSTAWSGDVPLPALLQAGTRSALPELSRPGLSQRSGER